MPNFNTIIVKQEKNITRIILDRPEKCNAFNDIMIAELQTALEAIEHSDTRVVLLQGNGKHFCAGADLQWMKKSTDLDATENYQDALTLANLLDKLANLSKPTIALAQGNIRGGGCGLMACCDFVIGSDKLCCAFSEVKLGLTPATIAPYVIRRIGYQAAKYYFISAETIDASKAHDIKLIDNIVSHDQLDTAANSLTETLCGNAPMAIHHSKQLLHRLAPLTRAVIMDSAFQLAKQRQSAEAREGVSAFFAKRLPDWNKK